MVPDCTCLHGGVLVYGDQRGFEWQQLEHEEPVVFTLEAGNPEQRGRQVTTVRVTPPDRTDLLPESIAHFTQHGHGGSHPHLAHEFVRSIMENRLSAIDAITAADWTAAGICANESALREGERVVIPALRSMTGRIRATTSI